MALLPFEITAAFQNIFSFFIPFFKSVAFKDMFLSTSNSFSAFADRTFASDSWDNTDKLYKGSSE